ncbi:imelysin family protein [Flammeovirga kamogawensis]|uniref:Imelysin family protein n=1 Tax=Flammeovirga kamogawensis TaxID=373891 RepID=A0ABX8GX27_9BACT|nr:imelysin family protein [Flammeovirga kamogawensis]MBB6460778.1 hypothetical protein [Flammeovirga kamogawensis]QWG08131.1 imelysin family protein [Flammeovirga kamogawensis]TRX69934.1 imelysin family protein [Flammeovirga kamogawensis]
MKKINLIVFIAFLATFFSCETDSNVSVNFSQEEMLSNYANNLIVPAFETYKASTNSLKEKIAAFTASPSEETLNATQEALKVSYTAWSKVNAYQFGPAMGASLLSNSNTFPTKYTDIESNIVANNWNLTSITANNKKGLPAIDYLLSNQESAAIVTAFSDENRKRYLTECVADLDNRANSVYELWVNGYAAEFSANTGNDPSSALSFIVNEYNKAYERCKNQRVGYPLAKFSSDLTPQVSPMSVESYYNQASLSLLVSNIESLENIFKGKGENDGEGLADYLDAYYESGASEKDLTAEILNQFDVIKSKLDACNDPFSDHISNNDQVVNDLYDELTKLVVLIKSDMSSVLSVKITYQDSDGD